MSDEASDHRAVLVLYPRLIVLAVRPGAGELYVPLLTLPHQSLVDEHAVVVGVYAADRYREDPGDGFQPLDDQ